MEKMSCNLRFGDAFRGINRYRVDARGRLTVPPKFREIIETQHDGKLFITMDLKGLAVCVHPYGFAEEIYEKAQKLSAHENKVARAIREFILPGEECEPDAQGRLLIPQILRESAGIAVSKDAVVVGKGSRFDVWNAEKWQQQRELWKEETSAAQPEDFKAVLTVLGRLDL